MYKELRVAWSSCEKYVGNRNYHGAAIIIVIYIIIFVELFHMWFPKCFEQK